MKIIPMINSPLKYLSHLAFSLGLMATSLITLGADQDKNDNTNNHDRWYQVEMIVFARQPVSNPGNIPEVWPTNINLSYPDNLIALKTEGNANDGFIMLPANDRQLNSQAASINKNYTLLFHQAWRQFISGKKSNIVFTAGKPFNGHYELEGSIALSVAQYLKLNTNLWLTQFAPAGTTVEETWPTLPALPAEATPTSGAEPKDYLIKRIVKINQFRSMRSQEIHYIDHPLLGIIIKIIPYDVAPRSAP